MIYLGVEYGCKYTLERPNGARAVFNDPTDADYVGVLSPESSGLDAPEMREDSAERVEADGAIFGDFYAGKRPVILQGEINATGAEDRNKKVAKLRAATNAKRDYATLSWEPKGAGVKVYVNLRRNSLRVTKGFLKEFQASMVAPDSRILSYTLKSASAKGITTASQEKSPTVAGQINATGFASWTNPGNIKANDATYATITVGSYGQSSNWLYAKTYGFTIPTLAVVTGVEVKPEHKQASANYNYLERIWISRNSENLTTLTEDLTGVGTGEEKAGVKSATSDFTYEAVPTVEAAKTFGGPTDLWRYYKFLTPTIVNSAAFGAGMYYNNGLGAPGAVLSVDWLPIKITYAEPAEVTATNEGDAAAPAVVKVSGPIENFIIRNETRGELLYYSGKLEAGRTLTFDTQSITVYETGTGITEPINRFGNISFPNDWLQISPGANVLKLSGQGGSAATELNVEWRNAWE